MTIIFNDGFDTGDATNWSGSNGSLSFTDSASIVHHGRCLITDGTRELVYRTVDQADTFFRFYVRRSATPSSNQVIAALSDGSYSYKVELISDTSNVLYLSVPSGSYNSGVTLTQNVWYCIEIERKTGSGNGLAKLWVDGILKVDRTTETITGNTIRVDLGSCTMSNYFSGYFDCVAIADAYIGPEITTVSNVLTLSAQYQLGSVNITPPNDAIQIVGTNGSGANDPILYLTNASLVTDNDTVVFGAISTYSDFILQKETGGGAFCISHGWKGCKLNGDVIAMTPPLMQIFASGPTNQPLGGRDYYLDPYIPIYNPPTTPLPTAAQMVTEANVHESGQVACAWINGSKNLFMWRWNDVTETGEWELREKNVSGYFDTLFLLQQDGCTPAHLDIGNLTVQGKIDMHGGLSINEGGDILFYANNSPNDCKFKVGSNGPAAFNLVWDMVNNKSVVYIERNPDGTAKVKIGSTIINNGDGTYGTLESNYIKADKKLTFKDPNNANGDYVEEYVKMLEDPLFPGTYNPILYVNEAMWVQKDVFANGYLGSASPVGSTGGGCIQIGSRFEHTFDPPRINLTSTEPGMDVLTITRGSTISGGGWHINDILGRLKCATIYVNDIKRVDESDWLPSSYSSLSVSNFTCGNLNATAEVHIAFGTATTRPVYANTSTGNGTLCTSVSSIRYKENIENILDASWIYNLQPIYFTYKDNKIGMGKQLGLIAEEVAQLSPNLVWNNEKGEPEGIHYEWLAVPLVVELKKLRKEVEALKSSIANSKASSPLNDESAGMQA